MKGCYCAYCTSKHALRQVVPFRDVSRLKKRGLHDILKLTRPRSHQGENMARRTMELLEWLLVDRQMTPEQLDALLTEQVEEDQFLDYKDGRELDNKKKATDTLRQYLSGFANSDGGILIIGVNEKQWKVTGCPAPGGGKLEDFERGLREWASDCVSPIAGHFSQRPEFCVVEYPGEKKVLVAWTARSLNLVPVYYAGKLIYYFRFDDQTLPAPDYLLRDLTLGRREHPYLQISDVSLHGWSLRYDNHQRQGFLDVGLAVLIENVGLSWTGGLMMGVIGYTDRPRGHVSQYLRSTVEVREPDIPNYSGGMSISHMPHQVKPEMAPFTAQTPVLSFSLPTRTVAGFYTPYVWDAAVYLLSKGSPPIWYRLSLNINSAVLDSAKHQTPVPEVLKFWETERLSGGRPVVAWRSVNEKG